MPATSDPIRTELRLPSAISCALLLVTCAMLCGCARGDFGRTRDNFRNDDMHRWVGVEATGSLGLRASQYQLTDKERLLRDLAYPLIEPPHSRPAWKTVFGDYQLLPAPWRQAPPFDRSAYGRLLIDEPHRSHSSRYNQLIEDVRDDITRFDPFFAAAVQVVELDKKRNASLNLVSELSPRERDDAIARMQENTLIVQWVQQCLEQRIASYRFALERLAVQAPHNPHARAPRARPTQPPAKPAPPPADLSAHPAGKAAGPPVVSGPVVGRAVVSKG